MNSPSLQLPVYEPAGRDVLFSNEDLLQHVLIVGATGSGKTVLLHRILEQMIRRRETGLLVFDAKHDDTVDRVRMLAHEAGRDDDLVVLGPEGDHYVNLFNPLKSLGDVDSMTSRLLMGSGSMGRDNAYWDESRLAMIDAALSLLVVQGKRVSFSAACNFIREWFFREEKSDRVLAVILAAESIAEKMSGPEKQKLLQALDAAAMWKSLDPRTLNNILSTLMCAVRPLLSISAARCFQSYGRPPFDVSEVGRSGRICVVSMNATIDPGVASLFFRIIKSDFFRAVQSGNGQHRIVCGIIADEMPLFASAEDVETLATVRSRGCFVAAATQGFAILDERLGIRSRKALIANFGTLVFMKSREEEVDAFAAVHLGTTKQAVKIAAIETDSDVLSRKVANVFQEKLVCPPGTLGRLSPHQGFVTSSGIRCPQPLTFVPWFSTGQSPKAFLEPDSVQRLKWLLFTHGFAEHSDAVTFRKAVQLCTQASDRELLLKRVREFFRSRAILVPKGLETLPTPWLRGLPGILWATRRGNWVHLPYMICEVAMSDGLLQLRFAQETTSGAISNRVSAWDQIRLAVNASLYPSRWRPLKSKHAHFVRSCRLDTEPAGRNLSDARK